MARGPGPIWPGHPSHGVFSIDVLIAFSCKARGLCPSCAGRRMANTGAHVVDRIIPAVPVRQWVLSLPFDVRARAAFDARFLTEVIRTFASALRERHRKWARSIALDGTEMLAIVRKVRRRVETLAAGEPHAVQLPLGPSPWSPALTTAQQSTRTATTSKRPSASQRTTTSAASTYFDIAQGRRSPSRASSNYPMAKLDIGSRSFAITATSFE